MNAEGLGNAQDRLATLIDLPVEVRCAARAPGSKADVSAAAIQDSSAFLLFDSPMRLPRLARYLCIYIN